MDSKIKIVEDLPQFSSIKPENIEKDLSQILKDNREKITEVLESNAKFSWDNLFKILEELERKLHNFWSPISHLHGVMSTEALREAYRACIPKLSEYGTDLLHNQKLFAAIQAIAEGDEYKNLNKAQKKVVDNHLRDFKLAGVALSEEKKQRFSELSSELAQLAAKFEENLLDATQGWVKHVTDPEQLKGLPEQILGEATEAARHRQLEGWVFTLEAPSYIAIMKYAESSALREEMYRAYTTRASDQGPNAGQWDNSEVMAKILKNRLELAKLLDFESYAHYSLATKMVKQPEQVMEFLNQLAEASYNKAKDEFAYLKQFAKSEHNKEELNAWDVAYYSEQLRLRDYDVSQEELRPYFPEYRVLEGLFLVAKKLFGIEIKPAKSIDVWSSEARAFTVYDADGKLRAQFYIDLYARKNKRGGAWMDDCRSRVKLDDGVQLPVAFITCNFNRPFKDQPALFTHEEVVTLFHEFGHSLQHMLTTVDCSDVSGINGVPWDAVEVASQFLENWAWEEEPIEILSEHFQTKKRLPEEVFKKMRRAENFQSAMQMLRQLEFSLFDFRLHREFDPKIAGQIQKVLNEVREKIAIYPTPAFNRFQHGFSHIFAGGYAAGYYSYKWAEVMAADAFSLFKEKGIFNQAVSQKFLNTFLESGGVEEPMDLFIQFRGRKPEISALLKQSEI